MADQIEETLELIDKERDWLLREFDYLRKLKALLEEAEKKLPLIKEELRKATEKSIRRQCQKRIKKTGRVEVKVNEFRERSLGLLRSLRGVFPAKDLDRLENHIKKVEIYSNIILKSTSLREGKLINLIKQQKEFNPEEILSEVNSLIGEQGAISSLIKLFSDLHDYLEKIKVKKVIPKREIVNEAQQSLSQGQIYVRRDELRRLAQRCECPLHPGCKYYLEKRKEGTRVRDGTTDDWITDIPKSPKINRNTARGIMKALATGLKAA